MKNTQDWHKDFFTNFYYELFLKRSSQKIAEEVNIIDELIGDKKTFNLMDVCCGEVILRLKFQKEEILRRGVLSIVVIMLKIII